MEVEIHVDGSCLGNPGPGGIGIILSSKIRDKEVSEPLIGSVTNNIAELKAAVRGLELLKYRKLTKVTMYSDSKLVVGWATKNWKAVAHPELVRSLKSLIAECKSFQMIKIDRLDPIHEKVDELAKMAALSVKEIGKLD
jgi:ribonuclease HI